VENKAADKVTGKAKGQRRKSIEEVVSYALGHRIRIEVLTLLNEGVYTPNQLAEILGEPIGTITHHVSELADGGAIELARTEQAGNWTRHFYRAVEQPYVSEEEALAMTPQQRQIIAGVVLQSIMAESMSAFWAGNMINDPSNVLLSWRWFNVDGEGQGEIIAELAASWERIQEIEARSTARRAESEEDAVSVIVAMQGFLRSRSSLKPPAPLGNPE
jgi:DNA-binding transcriptional ArsR family regulator